MGFGTEEDKGMKIVYANGGGGGGGKREGGKGGER